MVRGKIIEFRFKFISLIILYLLCVSIFFVLGKMLNFGLLKRFLKDLVFGLIGFMVKWEER